MANDQNLRAFSKLSKEEHLAASRKGGIASGETRRRRKTFKELIQIALELTDAVTIRHESSSEIRSGKSQRTS